MSGSDGGGERVRPETESVARVWATATRVTRARPEIETLTSAVAVPGARRPAALPSGSARPTWSEPSEVDDRTIYRRPDAVARRPGAREVQPEIVDGVPVYRIYRPMRSVPRGAG